MIPSPPEGSRLSECGDDCRLPAMSRQRSSWVLAGAALTVGAGFAVLSAAASAPDALTELSLASIGIELCLGGLAVGLAHVSREPPGVRLGLARGRLAPWQLALLVVGTLALSHALDGLLECTGLRDRSSLAAFEAVLAGARGGSLVLALLALAAAPALGEELLCRGLVQRGLEPRVGPGAAIVVAALVFGALHVDPVHAAFATVLGLYLGAVAWLAGSVRSSILCHGVNNACAVLFAAGLPGAPPRGVLATMVGLALAAAAIGLVARARIPGGRSTDPAS